MLPIAKKIPHIDTGVPFLGMAVIGCLPPLLKRAYYRRRGATIGKGVKLGIFSYIESPDIVLGDGVSIAPFTFIRTRGRCKIGARSSISILTAIDTGIFEMGEDSSIGEQIVIGGMLTPRSSLTIGSRVKILSFSVINPTEPIIIEDEVCIGGGSYIFTHGTWQSMLDGFPGSFAPVTIKRGAWLAWRGFVMPGITIGEEATIGGASVVTRDIPPRTLAIGAPAKPIKTGAEYIREPNKEQQHAMLLKWLEECAEFLTYTGRPAEFSRQGSQALLRVKAGGFTIAYHQQPLETVPTSANIVLSLSAIAAPLRQSLKEKHCAWFDVSARKCALIPHPMCEEFRRFLTRYGLRFAVVDVGE